MRALFGALVVGAIALTAGVIGFQAGVASNVASAGGVVWLGGGFPGFGFLVFLLFIGFLFFAFGGRRRALGHGPMGGHGSWGDRGPWGDGDPRRQWIADAHRRLHEEDATRGGTQAASGTTGAGATGSPFDPPTAG
jgi:hypothetical protein